VASRHTQRHLVGAHRLVSARPRQPGTQRAGLTSKPHHAQRPQVALRGSFCLRLASTFNHRPARSPHASYARAAHLLPRDVRGPRARGAAIQTTTAWGEAVRPLGSPAGEQSHRGSGIGRRGHCACHVPLSAKRSPILAATARGGSRRCCRRWTPSRWPRRAGPEMHGAAIFAVPDVASRNLVVHAVCEFSFTCRAMFPQPLFWIYGGRTAKGP
jgi:hypothetical protein